MAAPTHHMYIGAETGLLKGLNVEDGKWDNLTQISSVSRSNEICVMCWHNQNSEDDILYATRGGLVKSYSTVDHSVSDILQATDNDNQVIKGLFKMDSKYVTCTSDGVLSMWEDNNTDDSYTDTEPVRIRCGENVSFMNADPHHRTHVAVGGKENAVKLYDIERHDAGPVFQAKNVRNDFLDLRVPVWDTDVGFISKSPYSLVVTSTGYHKIRMYDPNTSQRRPVIDMEWEQYPITSLCISPYQDRQVMVGNTVGEQALLDIRNQKCLGKFKGGAGAIRSLQIHPTLPLVVSCGLDRYVRVHDMKTRVLAQKFYMKSRLNTFLISSKWGSEEEKEVDEIKLGAPEITNGEESPDSVADDALWDSLDTVTDTKASKAKKRPSIITNDSTNGSSKPKTKKKPKKKVKSEIMVDA